MQKRSSEIGSYNYVNGRRSLRNEVGAKIVHPPACEKERVRLDVNHLYAYHLVFRLDSVMNCPPIDFIQATAL